ncbi:C-type lectin domain family 19 member A-like [Antedon mediterranea]|uniref:C-type lectin domain family 19 member A-like n=1 Tax=Antedon mediterranea TaxID=105859 RepID=UPI003AF9C8FB
MKAILVLFSLVVAASAGCPPFWVQFRGQCYKYVNKPLTKLAASEYCSRYGSCDGELARLLSIESLQKDNYMHLLLSDYVMEPPTFPIWLGLTQDPQNQDLWMWESGNIIDSQSNRPGYTNWANNQPGEACARTFPNEFGHTWREVPCDRELRFVCEMPAGDELQPLF